MSGPGSAHQGFVDTFTGEMLGITQEAAAMRFRDFEVIRTLSCVASADAIQQNAVGEPMVVLFADETAEGVLITPQRGGVPFGQPWAETES